MSIGDGDRSFPRSMRQRKILDVASENPDTSIESLASMVPSATADLVERVLEEHGDPAGETVESSSTTGTADAADVEPADENGDDEATETNASDNTDAESHPSQADLTAKQRDVLEHVAAEPAATQQEIANQLDVSAATVNKRVNSIEGFDWTDRESFVGAVLDKSPSPAALMDGGATNEVPEIATDGVGSAESSDDEPETTEQLKAIETTLDRLEERMTDLEERMTDLEEHMTDLEEAPEQARTGEESLLDDPQLAHKMVHACMESDAIDESEELRILKALIG